MTRPTLTALTIGQSPRPDLVRPLADLLPDWQIRQVGALDGLTLADLPHGGQGRDAAYPLVTRMADGTPVTVAESFVTKRLQGLLDGGVGSDAVATVLLCAGTFAALRSDPAKSGPLIKPFDVARRTLDALGMQRLGLIAPVAEQETPIRLRWQAAGFDPVVWTWDIDPPDDALYTELYADLNQRIDRDGLDCIVLDYVGHDPAHVRAIQANIRVPVMELGMLAFALLAGMLAE